MFRERDDINHYIQNLIYKTTKWVFHFIIFEDFDLITRLDYLKMFRLWVYLQIFSWLNVGIIDGEWHVFIEFIGI